MDFDEGDTLIDAHFKLVTEMQPSEYHYMSAQMDCNVEKNRESSLIPLENSRIPLAPKPGVEGSDYINASWLSGHEKLKMSFSLWSIYILISSFPKCEVGIQK